MICDNLSPQPQASPAPIPVATIIEIKPEIKTEIRPDLLPIEVAEVITGADSNASSPSQADTEPSKQFIFKDTNFVVSKM